MTKLLLRIFGVPALTAIVKGIVLIVKRDLRRRRIKKIIKRIENAKTEQDKDGVLVEVLEHIDDK